MAKLLYTLVRKNVLFKRLLDQTDLMNNYCATYFSVIPVTTGLFAYIKLNVQTVLLFY